MPSPMDENSYRDHAAAVKSAAQADWKNKKGMRNAVEQVKTYYEPAQDGIFDIGVSGDGTWRKRGYSSSYGVVTALSTITGKALGGLGDGDGDASGAGAGADACTVKG